MVNKYFGLDHKRSNHIKMNYILRGDDKGTMGAIPVQCRINHKFLQWGKTLLFKNQISIILWFNA